ncbi:hypothetical protein KM043_008072 [Ampulex compressa]|nr:hypothetical protein KM043_008072 [Ampulex compressa]
MMAEDDAEEPPEVSESELRMAASRISIQKASGPDGIAGLAIMTAALNASALFQSTFSACLAEGYVVALVLVGKSIEEIEYLGDVSVEVVVGWLRDHGLLLAAEKTGAALISRTRTRKYATFTVEGREIRYLHRIKVMSRPECPACPGANADVGHVLFQCPRFVEEQSRYKALWKGPQTSEGIGTCLLSSRERWDGVVALATSIIDRLGLIGREIEKGGNRLAAANQLR